MRLHGIHIHKMASDTAMGKNLSLNLFNMLCFTGNKCYVVVINVKVLSYLFKNQTSIHKTLFHKYFFMCTEVYNDVLSMADLHRKKKTC